MHSEASLMLFQGYLCAVVCECIQNTDIARVYVPTDFQSTEQG